MSAVPPVSQARPNPVVVEEPKKVNSSCLEFLIMEMVPLSLRITTELQEDKPIEDYHFGGIEQLQDLPLLANENNHERIEKYGYQVGRSLLELIMFDKSETQDFSNTLNIMKLIARDLWKNLYLKQMDNLRTNHRGTYVLIDSKHRFITRFDSNQESLSKLDIVNLYLKFDCGVIKGVLRECSVQSSVSAELKQDGSVHYTIVI